MSFKNFFLTPEIVATVSRANIPVAVPLIPSFNGLTRDPAQLHKKFLAQISPENLASSTLYTSVTSLVSSSMLSRLLLNKTKSSLSSKPQVSAQLNMELNPTASASSVTSISHPSTTLVSTTVLLSSAGPKLLQFQLWLNSVRISSNQFSAKAELLWSSSPTIEMLLSLKFSRMLLLNSKVKSFLFCQALSKVFNNVLPSLLVLMPQRPQLSDCWCCQDLRWRLQGW